jgi:beta-lactamase superfamily II metal-dependent hydrolase
MPTTATAPAKGHVNVRMYRTGLGDCFLLTLRSDAGKPVHVLIDCGTWDTDPATVKRITDAVDDLLAYTGSHIHVLVATHEHWDHCSGFLQRQALFDKVQFDEVWLAWTEDPKDKLATRLKKDYAKTVNQLRLAINRLEEMNSAMGAAITDVVGCLPYAAAGVKTDPAKAMKWVRDRGKNANTTVRFFNPGDLVSVPHVSDARVYVLGPPRDETVLRDMNPTKTRKKAGVVYPLADETSALSQSFFAAVKHHGTPLKKLPPAEKAQVERMLPFDSTLQLDADHYKAYPIEKTYGSERGTSAWRRIDEDWLTSAAYLALYMSNYTNNTSLALAIEMVSTKNVMLFAADAQIGNWLSWYPLKFNVDGTTITMNDLLARTVLYKVGHHGSHNASLKKDGIERMKGANLVALIPTDRTSLSKGNKKTWKMPYEPLNQGLIAAAGGRVIRQDDGIGPVKAALTGLTCSETTTHIELIV